MTLRVALITSSARRHMAMASMLSSSGYLASLIIQKRDFRPARAHGLPENLWKLTQRHFQLRDSAESLFFWQPRICLGWKRNC